MVGGTVNLLMCFAYARSSWYGTSREAGGKVVAGVARSSLRVSARRVRLVLSWVSRAEAVLRRERMWAWFAWWWATVCI